MSQTYHFIAASRKFLCEQEPLSEFLKERAKNYSDRKKEIDFWFIENPVFLDAPELAQIKNNCPSPTAAVVSTDPQVIRWLKLRLEFVAVGEFTAPSSSIPDPLAAIALV
jgi:hypothetical protein